VYPDIDNPEEKGAWDKLWFLVYPDLDNPEEKGAWDKLQ
jgi:hypothetical protein